MDPIPIPGSEIAPIEQIADGLHGLRIVFVNVFSLAVPGAGWVLVDGGLPLSAGRIRHWAEELHGHSVPPQAIILTHGHFDHVSAISDLVKDWDVPIYAHPFELPFVTGKEHYPPPDPTVGGGLMSLMSPMYPKGPFDFGSRVEALPSDGSLPNLPDWRWIHTPGHTVGHVSFFRERDRALLVGDAFCTARQESFLSVAQQKPELAGPPAYYTPDWVAAEQSVHSLAALQPLVLAPGHGQPMASAEVPAQVEQLARDFVRVAVPEHGKYVLAQMPPVMT